MALNWLYRYFLMCSAADQAAANQVAFEVTGSSADLQTLTVPLSATGTGQATFYGASTAATTQYMTHLAIKLGAGRVLSIKYWRIDVASGMLTQTNVAASTANVGTLWSWEQCQTDSGLYVIAAPVLP